MKWPMNAAPTATSPPPITATHTYENRMAVWDLPIILYFTGPSLHRRCDWNNNHPSEPRNSPLPVGQQRTRRGRKKGRRDGSHDEDVAEGEESGRSQRWGAPWQHAAAAWEPTWVTLTLISPPGEITPLIQHALSDRQDPPSSPSMDMKRSPFAIQISGTRARKGIHNAVTWHS